MKLDFDLTDYILLSISVAAFGIGVHQFMYFGMGVSYWLFMIALGLPFYMQFRRHKRKIQEQVKDDKLKPQKTNSSSKAKSKKTNKSA